MKKYKCRFCNQEFEFEKQQQFASHSANCKENPSVKSNVKSLKLKQYYKSKNPKQIYKFNCKKCNKEYQLELKQTDYNKENYKKYCSRECANSHERTKESKLKTSTSAKNSEKVKIANTKQKNWFRGKHGNKKTTITNISTTCLKCNKPIFHKSNRLRKYHKECWLKCSGGYKSGSVKNYKSGWYKGYWCDSSYELAYVIYNLDHNIKFTRNKQGFEYEFKNKKLKFYPDFVLKDGTFIEIKNYDSPQVQAKLKFFPFKIEILFGKDLKNIFEYVIRVYGKNFFELYEGFIKEKGECLYCKKTFILKNKNVKFCSLQCSSFYRWLNNPVSLETKNKISLKLKGRKHTEETKKKMSKSRKGKVLTQEWKNKISKTLKKHYEMLR